MTYNWQQSDWTNFSYNFKEIEEYLYLFSEKIGVSKGSLKILPKQLQVQTLIDVLVSEAIKTSEIEGEFLSRKDVMSSVKNNLGLGANIKNIRDINAKGMAKLVTEVHNNYQSSLDEQMIFSSKTKILVGAWRTSKEPMQVISGSYGKEIIHFEAPPSKDVAKEMKAFIKWFNDTAPNGVNEIKYASIRSAIAHLYFETIHPFEDGNGRIGRAISEKALLQTVGYPILLTRIIHSTNNIKNYRTQVLQF